jgi:hypothetical protein
MQKYTNCKQYEATAMIQHSRQYGTVGRAAVSIGTILELYTRGWQWQYFSICWTDLQTGQLLEAVPNGVKGCTMSQESLCLWDRDSLGTQEGEHPLLEVGTRRPVTENRVRGLKA